MTLNEIIQTGFTTLQSHLDLPFDPGNAAAMSAGVVAAAGLLMVIRGARWAPALAGLTFLVLGGVGGWTLAGQIATPPPLTAAVAGVLAAFIGVGFFRLWQAGLLALVLVVGGMSAYFARDLRPQVQAWVDAAPVGDAIQLPAAGSVVGEQAVTWQTRAGELWSHLSTTVPNFQPTMGGIAVAGGLLGLIVGLLMPRLSRSIWAGSIGTALMLAGVGGLLQQFAPTALEWARANGSAAWFGVAVIWLTSVLYGFRTLPGRKPAASAAGEAAGGGAALA